MAIPDYQSIVIPLLKFASDQKRHSLNEAIDSLADVFQLTEAEREELMPDGKKRLFNHGVARAVKCLKDADLLWSDHRGYYSITEKGIRVINRKPLDIDVMVLPHLPIFVKYWTSKDYILNIKFYYALGICIYIIINVLSFEYVHNNALSATFIIFGIEISVLTVLSIRNKIEKMHYDILKAVRISLAWHVPLFFMAILGLPVYILNELKMTAIIDSILYMLILSFSYWCHAYYLSRKDNFTVAQEIYKSHKNMLS